MSMINWEKELNREQLEVVTKGDGPCLVLAGAGSGKTRAITYRVAYLLEKGVKPENILLVTFTNKAAREMLERVQELMSGQNLDVENGDAPWRVSTGTILPWSGTFHHIGYRILKKYATKLGFKNNFSVLDSDDSLALLKTCLKVEGIDRKERRFPSPKVIQSIMSYARNAEITIEETLELKHPNFLEIADTIRRIAEDYRNRKKEANVMDFDDLLVYWYLLLLKDLDTRNKYAEQFQYVLVDEYQDTNKIQASIINLLASNHNNLLVVGDDAQSIYSFRAADIKNILDFSATDGKGHPDAKIFKLETNYRSTPNILQVANDVIANNLNQYEKKLKSVVDEFAKPEVHAFQDQTEEAIFIVSRIEELMNEGVEPDKIAVLFRASHHSQALEMELVKRNIAYDYRGGVRFFERAHIKDVLAYLKILNNVEDRLAWSRVLNMQVGIGPAGVERIMECLRANTPHPSGTPLDRGELEQVGANLGAKAQVGWGDFLQVYSAVAKIIEGKGSSVGDLIREVIGSKYKEYLENEYPDYRERMQDLEQLAEFADKPDPSADSGQKDLNSFLAEATLQEGFNNALKNNTDNEEKIILSTVHQAKGLEWEAVFVINLASGQFPNDRALHEPEAIEEERRLFYVAVTRAKKYLHLTYSLSGGFNNFSQGPSMFLEEINSNLIDMNFAGGGTVWDDLDTDDTDYSQINADSDGDITYISEDSGGVKRRGFLKDINDL